MRITDGLNEIVTISSLIEKMIFKDCFDDGAER